VGRAGRDFFAIFSPLVQALDLDAPQEDLGELVETADE
jgi:hypothetical protein